MKCDKLQSELSNPLKYCAKCKRGSYCFRECQNSNWKSHQEECSKLSVTGGGLDLELDLSESTPVVEVVYRLPRKELAPDGVVKNYWHFSIRALPSEPPIHPLFAINPGARFIYTKALARPPTCSHR